MIIIIMHYPLHDASSLMMYHDPGWYINENDHVIAYVLLRYLYLPKTELLNETAALLSFGWVFGVVFDTTVNYQVKLYAPVDSDGFF